MLLKCLVLFSFFVKILYAYRSGLKMQKKMDRTMDKVSNWKIVYKGKRTAKNHFKIMHQWIILHFAKFNCLRWFWTLV
jgi:hypothetical protein